jgi:4'-phosphopantetheinyl transferase
LNTDTLHIWHGNCDDAWHQSFWDVLDANEQTRAEKFSNALLQKRYVVAHGKLRYMLAQLLNDEPKKLNIAIAEHGKPYLTDNPNVAFNLSHSAGAMVIAAGWNCQIGIDLETCQPRAGLHSLVDKCFADEEIAHWNALPNAQQTIEFYRFWTRKEALVKASGHGIAVGLSQCVVDPDNQNAFLRVPAVCGSAQGWRALEIALGLDKCCVLVTDQDVVLQIHML